MNAAVAESLTGEMNTMVPGQKNGLSRHADNNRIIAALPADCKARIFQQLTLQKLKSGDILYEPRDANSILRFPIDAVVALSLVLQDGIGSLVAIVGSDGMTGIRALFGRGQAMLRAQVIVSGSAYTLPAAYLRSSMDQHPNLRDLIMGHMQHMIDVVQQNVACAAHHSTERRLSRLLLEICDRVESDRLRITQEQLAGLLGVRREGISHAASSLKALNALNYARGNLEIVDRGVLEEAACECYRNLRDKMPSR